MKSSFRALVQVTRADSGIGVELFRLDDIAVMRLYAGEIGKDFGIPVKKFAEVLDSFSDVKRLDVHLNPHSGADDVFVACAIYSIVSDHPAPHKIAYIYGVAAGTATIIMCACDEIIARSNSSLILCEPRMIALGDADTMRHAAEDLEGVIIPIVNVYKAQVNGKITEKEIRRLMEDEIPMSAQDALKKGFITSVRTTRG